MSGRFVFLLVLGLFVTGCESKPEYTSGFNPENMKPFCTTKSDAHRVYVKSGKVLGFSPWDNIPPGTGHTMATTKFLDHVRVLPFPQGYSPNSPARVQTRGLANITSEILLMKGSNVDVVSRLPDHLIDWDEGGVSYLVKIFDNKAGRFTGETGWIKAVYFEEYNTRIRNEQLEKSRKLWSRNRQTSIIAWEKKWGTGSWEKALRDFSNQRYDMRKTCK
jgi:hypothetical protein